MKLKLRLVGKTFFAFSMLFFWQNSSFAQMMAYAKIQKPHTENVSSISLKDALRNLKSHYKIDILFEDKVIEGFNVSVNSLNYEVKFEKSLGNILRPLGLRYKKIKDGSYLVMSEKKSKITTEADARFQDNPTLTFPNSPTQFGESKLNNNEVSLVKSTAKMDIIAQFISGTVTDSESGQGLPGVSIGIKNTTTGTSTDGNGNFRLSVPDEKTVLVFSYVGYLNQEVSIGNRTKVNVAMVLDTKTLSEVVVVGYGSQERKDVTGAVSTIKTQNLKDFPVTSIDQKMAGQVAGVQVSQVTGAPGSGPVIRIRGAGSLGAGDDPLYVVDGFPVTNSYNKFSNPLSTISPDDIESISILKDASATAIYGSRGSNGVVLITTKKAKSGVTNIEFSAYTGTQVIADRNRVQMMTAEQFAQNRIDGQVQLAAIKGVPYNISSVAEAYRNPAALGAGTDWFKELTRAAPMQNYNLNISKGTETLRSMISIGYFNQQGTLMNTDFQRFSVRANFDANLGKKVTVGLNIAPSFSIRHLAETEGHFNNAIITQSYLNSPLPSVYQADGTFTPSITSTGLFVNANPVNMLVNTTNNANNIRSLANVYLGLEIMPGLKFLTTFNADILFDTQDKFTPTFVGGFRNPPPTLATGSNYTARTYNWLSENTLNYSKSIKDHRFTALVGYSVQKETNTNTTVNGNGYADDVIQTINSALVTGVTAGAGGGKASLLSYLGRATYAFKDKYLVNVAVRRDGSSKFGADNRWGTFPSASVGWRISEEKFFPQNDIVGDLKLRASYGLAGNNNIGNFTALQLLSLDNYVIGGKIVTGQAINSLGNSNLGWEQSKQTDIGLDASLFKGKLSLVLELYERFTQSMLQSVDIPASSGFTTAITNLGNVRNRGIEISLSSRNVSTKKFHWDTDFNISFNRNKVINLGNRTRIQSGDNGSITLVDQPMGLFYGYKKAGGFFNTADDLAKYPRASVQTIGSIRFEDINGDGKIDGNDQTVIGSPYADFTWGMTNRVTYGNIDFSVLVNGSQGGQILDFYKRFTYNQDGVFNLHSDVLNSYKDVNIQGNGNVQSTGSALAGDSFSRNTSDAWVMDASYMVVRNVTLGYSFKPKKYVKGLRLYFSGQNLLTVSPYKGAFPEVGFNGNNSLAPGVNYGSYPIAATYTVGLNCKF